MTELCTDCPDHEACMTNWPCDVVRAAHPQDAVSRPGMAPQGDQEPQDAGTGIVPQNGAQEVTAADVIASELPKGMAHPIDAALFMGSGATPPDLTLEVLTVRAERDHARADLAASRAGDVADPARTCRAGRPGHPASGLARRKRRATTQGDSMNDQIAKCSSCRRERTALDPNHPMDAYDYSPLQVITGRPMGWYSGDDGEVCPECMERTIRSQS